MLVDGAPFLLPGEEVAIRPALEQWFEVQHVRPRIVGEFDDSALLKAFGQGGAGLFVAPTAIAGYVCRQYDVRAVGRIESVVEQLYAITTERRMQHPAAVTIRQTALREVFGAAGVRGAPSDNNLVRQQRNNRSPSTRKGGAEAAPRGVRRHKDAVRD